MPTMTIAEALAYAQRAPASHSGRPFSGGDTHRRSRDPQRPVASQSGKRGRRALRDDRQQHHRYLRGPGLLDVPRIGGTPATATGRLSPYASTFVGAGLLPRRALRFWPHWCAARGRRCPRQCRETGRRRGLFGCRFQRREEAFFSVLAAKGIVRIADEAYTRSLVHRDLAKRGVDSGLRSPIDLDARADADLTRHDVGRVRARGGLAIAQSVLAASVGAPEPAIDTADEPPTSSDMPALHDALAMAEKHDPQLAAAIAQLKVLVEERALRADRRRASSGHPSFHRDAVGPLAETSLQVRGPIPTGDGWLPTVPNWDAGLLLTWPLFDGVIVARRDAAVAEEQARRDEIDVTRLLTVTRVRQTYEQVQVVGTQSWPCRTR